MLRYRIVIVLMALFSALPLAAAKPPVAGPVTREEMLQEIDQKLSRVQQYLQDNNLGGLLITQVRNFSWITAGIADNHIVITSETGAASLLIMRDGKKYVIATNSEIPRLTTEDLNGLGYEAREFKWYENRTLDIAKEIAAGQTIATDTPMEGLRTVDIAPLRAQLTPTEMKKYRWLGRQSTEAVIATINQIHPGMSERQIEAIISGELMRREIRPTVLLIGSDERLYNFRHATPSDARLQKYGMVNICARRWGLVIAVTRFVHFGPIPPELSKRLQAAANVNANFYAHTRPGMKAGDLLDMAKKWYAENGFDGEWQKHHQGGAIGYGERDWVATPGSQNPVNVDQAFAWNPTVMGAKIEDTIIVHQDGYENITETPGWPTITSTVEGKTYKAPAILVRSAGAGKKKSR
jgi:Xaa-Pro dipeptidase